jgi:hypothetical protein
MKGAMKGAMKRVMKALVGARARELLMAGVLAMATSAPAQAQDDPAGVSQPGADRRPLLGLAVSLDTYGLRRFDDSYQLWDTGERSSASGLEVGYDLIHLGQDTRLALALGGMKEKQRARQPETGPVLRATGWRAFGGDLETTSLHAAATVRWRSRQALQPYAGLALGGTRSKIALDVQAGGAVRSTAHGLLGRACLGLRLQPSVLTVKRQGGPPLFGLGLGLELGAQAGTTLTFTARPAAPPTGRPETAPIPTQPVPLGDLSPTGGYARLAVLVVF